MTNFERVDSITASTLNSEPTLLVAYWLLFKVIKKPIREAHYSPVNSIVEAVMLNLYSET